MAYYQASAISLAGSLGVAQTGVKTIIQHPPTSLFGDAVVGCVQGTITFPSGTNLVAADVIEWCVLPSDHVPVDWELSGDQFDSNAAPTLTLAVGVMTGNPGDGTRTQAGNFAGSPEGCSPVPFGKGTVASPQYIRNGLFQTFQAYGQLWARVAPLFNADRSIGSYVGVAAATNPATSRRMDFKLWYRNASYGA